MFPLQWGLRNTGQTLCGQQALAGLDLDLVDAWDITFGAETETIAVLENGIDITHEEFGSGNYVLGPGVSTGSQEHHGTIVVGVLSGDTNNGLGIAGVAPGCVPHLRGFFGQETSPAAVSQAIAWSTENRRTIVNMSLGMDSIYFHPPSTPPHPSLNAMNDVCLNGLYAGQFLVAASGNDDDGRARYPAAFDRRVVAVGGIGPQTDTLRWADKYFFDPGSHFGSTYGPWLDFSAPANMSVAPKIGPSEYVDFEECNYYTATWGGGTSYAAPVVAGIAGLLRSVEPRLLGEDLFEILARTARDLRPLQQQPDDSSGYGLPQARGALDYLAPATKAFVHGRIGAYGTHGTLEIIESRRELRTFKNFPQLACPSCTESTTVYRLRGRGSLAAGFTVAPALWARSSGTVGFLDSTTIDYEHDVFRGRIVPGTVTSAACSLETYVFQVDGHGWIPAPPESARIAFSALGTSGLVDVDDDGLLKSSARAYPNPARGEVRFEFSSHIGGHARIVVYDVRGRRVRMLHDGPLAPGKRVLVWDGQDAQGAGVAPGAYFIRYERGGEFLDRKVVLVARPAARP